ncbi:hypothetical protein [Bradyrhizobium yuanmingense]|nr:hypothetical protein [Bradyrhizobium yuanmingense]
MSKIVDDYLAMFGKLAVSQERTDRTAESDFFQDRLKLRALRIQMLELSSAVSKRSELHTFHRFFELAAAVFGDDLESTPSNVLRRLLEQEVLDEGDRQELKFCLNCLMGDIERSWRELSGEYAILKLNFTP